MSSCCVTRTAAGASTPNCHPIGNCWVGDMVRNTQSSDGSTAQCQRSSCAPPALAMANVKSSVRPCGLRAQMPAVNPGLVPFGIMPATSARTACCASDAGTPWVIRKTEGEGERSAAPAATTPAPVATCGWVHSRIFVP